MYPSIVQGGYAERRKTGEANVSYEENHNAKKRLFAQADQAMMERFLTTNRRGYARTSGSIFGHFLQIYDRTML